MDDWWEEINVDRIQPRVVVSRGGEIGIALYADGELMGVIALDTMRRIRDQMSELIIAAEEAAGTTAASLRKSSKAPFN